jgi:hypothetical protein
LFSAFQISLFRGPTPKVKNELNKKAQKNYKE